MNELPKEYAELLSAPLASVETAYTPVHFSGELPLAIVPKKLNYIFTPGKLSLSYSRIQTLRLCPRMFLCKELLGAGEYKPSLDTAYGHAFAAGIQELFVSGSISKSFLAATEAWDYPYLTDPWGKKADKSFWACLASINMWYVTEFQQLNDEYKIAILRDKEAVELFVYIEVGEGYNYQIHIDLILEHRETGNLKVVEIKTSGLIQQPANWENSLQTLGYYTVVQAIAAMEQRYVEPEVLYIVQQTGFLYDHGRNNGFHQFSFIKGIHAPAEFMQDLAVTTASIETSLEYGYFPKYGHSCVQYSRPCQYYGQCDSLQTMQRAATVQQHYEENDLTQADYVLTFDSIIELLQGNSHDSSD